MKPGLHTGQGFTNNGVEGLTKAPVIFRPSHEFDATYRIFRACVRVWFSLIFRRIRLLQTEMLQEDGPALLLVNHPASFMDALILIAAFEKRVRCLLPSHLLKGGLRRLCARWLGMAALPEAAPDLNHAAAQAARLLDSGETLVVFAERRAAPDVLARPSLAALVARECAADAALRVLPVHLFLPVAPSQTNEILIHVDSPAPLGTAGQPIGNDTEAQARGFDSELERACRQNPFRLHPEQLEHFLAGLEAVLRKDLAENWESRPQWQQAADEFQLSGYISEMVRQLNSSHPGRLLSLYEALDEYHEMNRLLCLDQFRIETSSWYASLPGRYITWFETILGFPVAVFGAVNHLLAAILLFWFNLFKQGLRQATAGEWVGRAVIVLASYVAQVSVANHSMGRAAAGYYAILLPATGAYLLRYAWLVKNRDRLLLSILGRSGRQERLRHMRRELVSELNLARDRYAGSNGGLL